MTKYCVPIVYTGLSNFIVETSSEEEAIEKARQQFAEGDVPDLLGNEYEDIERVGDVEIVE
jgi:hypothetical protein